jgi:hypothetical protein
VRSCKYCHDRSGAESLTLTPLRNTALLGQEARGILLGLMTIGGMVYNVFEGERTETYEQGE